MCCDIEFEDLNSVICPILILNQLIINSDEVAALNLIRSRQASHCIPSFLLTPWDSGGVDFSDFSAVAMLMVLPSLRQSRTVAQVPRLEPSPLHERRSHSEDLLLMFSQGDEGIPRSTGEDTPSIGVLVTVVSCLKCPPHMRITYADS